MQPSVTALFAIISIAVCVSGIPTVAQSESEVYKRGGSSMFREVISNLDSTGVKLECNLVTSGNGEEGGESDFDLEGSDTRAAVVKRGSGMFREAVQNLNTNGTKFQLECVVSNTEENLEVENNLNGIDSVEI
ncbi:hypothetical protein GALMADRAFT_145918 [Galerina marginata CBS 339.88]|uniref:Cyanovirin-N domain-containing protein n=1 Tax=Galerina marginata (strain CBS 339.88) TaxID=685588 RepID=A0A067SDC1_GALM3|nr:hypothetical protein GALMADRAFT_145918 [Galerina marginata CBS 339.88]